MWLETKGMPNHKHYIFILQLLGKECLHYWESFLLMVHNDNDKEQPCHVWKAFGGSFRQAYNFRSCREQTLSKIHQLENDTIADLHTRLNVLLQKWNYS